MWASFISRRKMKSICFVNDLLDESRKIKISEAWRMSENISTLELLRKKVYGSTESTKSTESTGFSSFPMKDYSKLYTQNQIEFLHNLDNTNFSCEASKELHFQKSCKILHIKEFLGDESEVKKHHRYTLMEWIFEVVMDFEIDYETFDICANIIDEYLSKVKVEKSKLQLTGVTSLVIACKFNEIYFPPISDFMYITAKSCSETEIRELEIEILKTIEFRLSYVSLWGISRIIWKSRSNPNNQKTELIRKTIRVMHVFFMILPVYRDYDPFTISATVYNIIDFMNGTPFSITTPKLVELLKIKSESIQKARKKLISYLATRKELFQKLTRAMYGRYGGLYESHVEAMLGIPDWCQKTFYDFEGIPRLKIGVVTNFIGTSLE